VEKKCRDALAGWNKGAAGTVWDQREIEFRCKTGIVPRAVGCKDAEGEQMAAKNGAVVIPN